jgi:RimJ/RimL family protein N-acetyltransferase
MGPFYGGVYDAGMASDAGMRTVVGEGMVLEPQLATHAREMFALLSDPAIYAHENAPPESEAWLARRFQRLEGRASADGSEAWLNWVVRLPTGEAIGYVQATVGDTHRAGIAYVFASRYWGRGLARRAVEAMIAELGARYGVRTLTAVLKASNVRSSGLLRRLGFTRSPDASDIDADEIRMQRAL